MPLPTIPLLECASPQEIVSFEADLRDFVNECYPGEPQKANAAWKVVEDKKSLSLDDRKTLASLHLIARLNAIYSTLDTIKVPNARALEDHFGFNF